MKRLSTTIISAVIALSICACGGGTKPAETTTAKVEPVELTKDNINDYVQFDGSFVDGKYSMGIINIAEATLEFQAYPTASGKFNNVQITLVAKSKDDAFTYMNKFGNYWHLADAGKDAKSIEFNFTLGVDGKFSKKYSVECLNNTGKLDSDADFEIVSISGTFTPE